MSMITIGVLGTLSDPDAYGKCPNGQYLVRKTDGGSGYINKCADSNSFSYDCEYYDAGDNCVCPSASDLQSVKSSSFLGCVPIAQQLFNCPLYVRNKANLYECSGCPIGFQKIINISTIQADNNPTQIPKACAT